MLTHGERPARRKLFEKWVDFASILKHFGEKSLGLTICLRVTDSFAKGFNRR